MTIACGLDEHDGDVFAAALGGPVRLLPDVATVLRVLRVQPDESLVVLGPGVPDLQVLRCAAHVRSSRPGALLVLLRTAANRQQRHVAVEAGVDAVLDATDPAAAGARCREFLDARSAGRRGRTVTVFAGKGGCGKTTIAVNLALALAEDPARRVCLVDLDLRSGDLAVALGLDPDRTLAAGTDVDAVVTPLGRGVDCALAPVAPGAGERLEAEGVGATLDALAARYDVVVVDTPSAFTRPVLSALDRSEHHVLVTTPERPALHNLRATLDTLDLLGHRPDGRSIVFNRSDSRVGLSADDVERILHAPIAAHVPSSRDVALSVNACVPLMTASPGHPVSAAIRAFARARLASPTAAPRSPMGAP